MKDIAIIDVDGGIDDVYALILLINAETMGLVTIAAIICSMGNTILFHSCRNVMRILETLDRTNIPLYQGVNKTLVAPMFRDYYFGHDGFGDVENLWEPNMTLLRKQNPAEILYNITNKYPGRVSLISVGPLSFAAVALIQYDNIQLKDIWIMGGNSTESPYPEFNWHSDPEAAYGVLSRIGVPTYILTFQNSEDPLLTMEWRENTLGSIQNDVMALLNAGEKYLFDRYPADSPWIMCDALLIGAMFYKEIHSTKSEYCATVSLNSTNDYNGGGYLLLETNCFDKNVILLENINTTAYADVLYRVLSSF